MKEIIGDLCHEQLIANTKQALGFSETQDYAVWKSEIKEKLIELLGIKEIEKNVCPLKMTIEKDEMKDGYRQIRFIFESEKGALVPCYLLIPDTGKEKYPVAITLQGHNKMGFHSSIGNPISVDETTYDYDLGRGMFAVQAVKHGYIALAIDQRGMGQRRARNRFDRRVSLNPDGGCYYEAMTGIAMGRTLIGERCWDVSRAIDLLANFPECDTQKIVITGNSGGGTASFYAACVDERIKISAPSCAFCSYADSILRVYHCSCNYIPQSYRYFDMQDLACLIAPRRLAIVAGEYDTSFFIEGVTGGYETVKKIYEKAGAKGNCRLVINEKGHWWCEDVMWSVIDEELEKLNKEN